jgi:hypothetical protein
MCSGALDSCQVIVHRYPSTPHWADRTESFRKPRGKLLLANLSLLCYSDLDKPPALGNPKVEQLLPRERCKAGATVLGQSRPTWKTSYLLHRRRRRAAPLCNTPRTITVPHPVKFAKFKFKFANRSRYFYILNAPN